MKNKEIETLLRTSAMARTEKNTPAGQLYADLCGDLDGWCRQRRQARRHRRTLLSVGLMALAVLFLACSSISRPVRTKVIIITEAS